MHKKLATTTKANAREIYVHHTSLPVIPHVVNLAAYEFYLFEILNYQQQNPSVWGKQRKKGWTELHENEMERKKNDTSQECKFVFSHSLSLSYSYT